MYRAPWILGLCLFLLGCHAKLQQAAPSIGALHTQVQTTGGPWVDLGQVPEEAGIVGDVITGLQVAKAVRLSQRLQDAMDGSSHEEALHEGVLRALGEGALLGFTANTEAVASLELEVRAYGLYVKNIGQDGVFTYKTRVRMWGPSGERLYRKRLLCTADIREVLGREDTRRPIQHAKEIDRLSDSEIQAIYLDLARSCGEQVVHQMRAHAGIVPSP